mgnify:CR=1 FL=1
MARFRIVGAGVSGSYLYSRLRDTGDVEVLDKNPNQRGHSCGWGSYEDQLKHRLSKVGLDLEDYVLNRVRRYVLNGVSIKIRNQVIVDKPRMLEDLLPAKEVVKGEVSEFRPLKGEVLINATSHPFVEHNRIALIQHRVAVKGLERNTIYIYIHPKFIGYGWAFPISDSGRDWHLGGGCSHGDPSVLVEKLKRRYGVEEVGRLCSCGREIRVVDPEKAVLVRDRVVSIGEAAGVVEPITCEGILPSIDSAEILYNSLHRDDYAASYEESMLEMLSKCEPAYEMWRLMHRHHRWAWLKGFGYIVERAESNIKPELTVVTKLKLVKEILFGQMIL